MTISLKLTRDQCIDVIVKEETNLVIRASIEHFALPIIAGFRGDELTQQEFEEMGGQGKKPEPLSPERKLEFYERIKGFLLPIIKPLTAELVNSVLLQVLEQFSKAQLRLKVTMLNGRVKEAEPNWSKLSELYEDHTCLFRELKKSTHLRSNLITIHDEICAVMSKYRDSGELFHRIRVNELR